MNTIVSSRSIVIVYLAADVQGSAVVRAALARGVAVRALVSDMTRAPSSPADRLEFVDGDLDDRRPDIPAARFPRNPDCEKLAQV